MKGIAASTALSMLAFVAVAMSPVPARAVQSPTWQRSVEHDPADRITNPRDGRQSTSRFTDSRQLAGTLVWYYEVEGMRPVLIGLSKLRRIPDSVMEFSGFSMERDFIAGHYPGSEPYAATDTAIVSNVTLSATYTHIGLPQVTHLATNAVKKNWCESARRRHDAKRELR